MSEHNQALRQAYEMIKTGDKKNAYQKLVPILKADKDNANAWWLLANCAPSPDKARMALKHVLRLRPDNAKAQQMLRHLDSSQQPTAPTAAPVPAAQPEDQPFWADFPEPGEAQTKSDNPFQYLDAAAAEAAPARPRASAKAAPKPQKQPSSGGTNLIVLGGIGVIAVVVIAVALILAVNKLGIGGGGGSGSDECPASVEVPLAVIEQDRGIANKKIAILGCVAPGKRVTDSIEVFSADGWAFWGEAGESYTIEVNAFEDFVDMEVYLFGPDGRRAAYNDDFDLSSSLNARLDLQVNVSGTYTVMVSLSVWGFVGGDYELKVY